MLLSSRDIFSTPTLTSASARWPMSPSPGKGRVFLVVMPAGERGCFVACCPSQQRCAALPDFLHKDHVSWYWVEGLSLLA